MWPCSAWCAFCPLTLMRPPTTISHPQDKNPDNQAEASEKFKVRPCIGAVGRCGRVLAPVLASGAPRLRRCQLALCCSLACTLCTALRCCGAPLQEISEAFDVLSDPQKRQVFDACEPRLTLRGGGGGGGPPCCLCCL